MMRERMKRFKKLSVAAAVCVAALAMSATTAMAKWNTDGTGNADSVANDGGIVIGKSLKTPVNWDPTTLNVEFTISDWKFAKVGEDYADADGITFTGNPVALNKDKFTDKKKDAKEQVKYWGAESGDLLQYISYDRKTGLDALAAFAKAQGSTGSVKFTVTETKFEYTDDPADTTSTITSVSSKASYDLVFYIDYVVVDGTPQYKVTSITDTKTKKDDGTSTSAKVDPTPGSTDVKETTYTTGGEITDGTNNLSYQLSGMLFNNDITKNEKPDTPDNPDANNHAFVLSKTVTGTGASADQEFTFNVKLTAPALAGVNTTTPITYNIIDESGNKVGDSHSISYGTEAEITLKGGQKAVFGQMYNSTKIEITENGTPGYKPSYTGTYGDSTAQTVNTGDSLTMTASDGKAYGITQTKADQVGYSNDYQSLTPTGIIMNNLPFFMMILIGAVAAVSAFVFRARRRVAGR